MFYLRPFPFLRLAFCDRGKEDTSGGAYDGEDGIDRERGAVVQNSPSVEEAGEQRAENGRQEIEHSNERGRIFAEQKRPQRKRHCGNDHQIEKKQTSAHRDLRKSSAHDDAEREQHTAAERHLKARQQKGIRLFHAVLTVQKADGKAQIGNDQKAVALERQHSHFLRGNTVEKDSRKADDTTDQLTRRDLFRTENDPCKNDIQKRSDGIEHRGVHSRRVGKSDIHKEVLPRRLNETEDHRLRSRLPRDLKLSRDEQIRNENEEPRAKESDSCEKQLVRRCVGQDPKQIVTDLDGRDRASPQHGA